MLSELLSDTGFENPTPIHLVAGDAETALARFPARIRDHAKAIGWKPAPYQPALMPGTAGRFVVLAGKGDAGEPYGPLAFGRLPLALPAGDYRLVATGLKTAELEAMALAWMLAQYRYGEFKQVNQPPRRLVAPRGVDVVRLRRIAEAVAFGRDLVNRPANALGPEELALVMRDLAAGFGADYRETVGEDLLRANFPMIHAVGRASTRAPRLLDLVWGDPQHPRVTLVGKGVCFDTGGLNIKPDAAMLLMKKDMGGAATALAAGQMLMAAGARIRLRILVPAVENSISGSAFRPGDVLPSRKGLTVEIGNTDAEGRLVLADALTLAEEENPALLLDFATLTGAARVALGPELPPFYTHDEVLAAEIARHGALAHDPVWRLPLWKPYAAMLESKIADINHVSGGSHAGSITAALFLSRFVSPGRSWAHFDVFNWTPAARPARPEGGEVQAARLAAALVLARYGSR